MCGIFGVLGSLSKKFELVDINNIINTLKRRGPDSSNFFYEKNGFIGHTRLSLIDLTSSGNQPMKSERGNIISFNGEIYNFNNLKKDYNLKVKSTSDTEVLLKLIEKKGFENSLKDLTGMFAIAYYSPSEEVLFLSRDRLGEKPLYYFIKDKSIFFASDIKSIISNNYVNVQLSNEAIEQYFKYGFVSSPLSIYQDIYKLNPGEMMKVNFNGGEISGISRKYWFDLKETFLDQNNKNLSYSEILNHSHKLITESVKSQLISDAKVGSFLSGGIDSSLITAIMAKELNNLETFTLGSSDERFDESDLVKQIVRYLNISNNLIFLDDVNIELHLDNLAASFSEPLADSSQLSASIVSSIASKKVKSVLTGDGGDEVFGGYYRYGPGLKTWRYLSKLKKIPVINKFLRLAETNIPEKIFHIISKLGINNARDKIRKLINLNSITNLEDYYLYLMSNSLEKSPSYLKLMSEKKILLKRLKNLSDEKNLYYWDQKNYLPDNNLAKIDRITMFYSLESRAPFLDKKLISFMNNISHSQKVKFGLKSILKDIHSIYFPRKFKSSAKKGFSFPLDSIMRTKLKDWSHYWLNYNSHNLLDLIAVNKLWKLHLSGINYSPDLWRIICFNRWYFFHKKKNYSI